MTPFPASPAVLEHARTAPRVDAPHRVLQPFQIRLIEEKQSLDANITWLADFATTAAFRALDELERARIRRELALKSELSTVLGGRIAAFEGRA